MKGQGMDKVREALAELVAYHTEEAGLTMSMVANRADFDEFMERCQQRLDAALAAAREALSAQPVVFVDEHVETFVSQYNDVYCDQRKAGVSGGDAERKAMKEVLLFALGAYTAQPACGCRIGECESKPLPFACRMAEEVKRGES